MPTDPYRSHTFSNSDGCEPMVNRPLTACAPTYIYTYVYTKWLVLSSKWPEYFRSQLKIYNQRHNKQYNIHTIYYCLQSNKKINNFLENKQIRVVLTELMSYSKCVWKVRPHCFFFLIILFYRSEHGRILSPILNEKQKKNTTNHNFMSRWKFVNSSTALCCNRKWFILVDTILVSVHDSSRLYFGDLTLG